MNKLEMLKQYTKVVADTGEIDAIKAFKPEDATTNPSLIYKAAKLPQYAHLLKEAVTWASQKSQVPAEQKQYLLAKLAVNFGLEILKIVPGRVSTEVDARLSFDTGATVSSARELIALYEQNDINRERILIKIASTWEGIKAAEILEKEGIHCNLTLLFSMSQAVACADAGVTLISPFVGRITDWYKKQTGKAYTAETDPGVLSVKRIYDYYKKFGYNTIVMGASFRYAGQIEALSGCDALTIGPNFLAELQNDQGRLSANLTLDNAKVSDIARLELDEKAFRWHLNEDAMATEKLAEGIRLFSRDIESLEGLAL